jgi:hypothetical protein
VRFSPPEFFKVSGCVGLLPTCTLPKLKLVGFPVRSPTVTAVPESAIFTGLVAPSLVRARFPLTLPANVGLKTTLKVVLAPAASVKGKFRPVVEKPVPVTSASEMVILLALVFVSESD